MTRFMLIAMIWVVCAGCYREPTDPAKVRQNAEARNPATQPAMPQDSIHAGLADTVTETTATETIASRTVEIGTYGLTAPDQWMRKKLNSPFLLAEFSLPKAEGDADDGRLTVSSAGGTVESNLDRWKGQFGGKPDKESQETIEVGGVKIICVDYSGAFADQRGPAMAATPKAGYRMLGAIVPLGEQLFFVKGYGPEKTVAAHADAIRSFLLTLQPKPAGE